MIEITLNSSRDKLTSFRYFWMKRVTGFNPAVHCARCLIGGYEKAVGSSMAANVIQRVECEPGEVFYLCGVSAPYRWEKNAHIAFLAAPGESCELVLYNGDSVTINGAREIQFDDRAARLNYPGRSDDYLTCRNFQFGAHYFSEW